MKSLLTGVCVLALGAGVLTGCTESGNNRVGDRPGERTPSASPPTTTSPSGSPSTPGSSPSTPSGGSSTSGSGTTSGSGSTSGSGTK